MFVKGESKLLWSQAGVMFASMHAMVIFFLTETFSVKARIELVGSAFLAMKRLCLKHVRAANTDVH